MPFYIIIYKIFELRFLLTESKLFSVNKNMPDFVIYSVDLFSLINKTSSKTFTYKKS